MVKNHKKAEKSPCWLDTIGFEPMEALLVGILFDFAQVGQCSFKFVFEVL